ncbi:cytochrome P450 [Schizopora paradoxa]|uniref:Cytochrome P450 n=1 Tax=Schizopora paradoxa TaxID=27342 RepID=A0A0H2QZY5_9AGAM|nr:cytochrome P450 [Schizopora paradoxa]
MDMLAQIVSKLSPLEIAVCAVVTLFGIYWAAIAFYQLFLSPLRKIPGPWYAAISNFWITTHVLRLQRCRAIDGLLRKYGPIVRVAPNKVIFNDVPTTKLVYGVSAKLDKSEFYSSLKTNGNDHAMTVLNHADHGIRKRGYASHYVQANLNLFESDFQNIVLKMIDMLYSAGQHHGVEVDTLLLFRHMMIDINGVHMFNFDAKSLSAWSDHIFSGDSPNRLSMAISDYPKRGMLIGILPDVLWNALQYIPWTRWQYFYESSNYVGKFVEDRLIENRRLRLANAMSERRSLMDRLLAHKYSDTEPMPDKDVVSECVGHLIAGSDTASLTLSFICWELSRRPDVMLRLQAELDAAMPDSRQIPDLQTLQSLPLLTAVLKEGLRIYTAGPSPLERVAPGADGKTSPMTLLGYEIPPGTIIASQAWTTHRQADTFFCPDLFLPERWMLDAYCEPRPNGGVGIGTRSWSTLSNSQKEKIPKDPKLAHAELSAHLFPFGHGPRVCGGQNLAQMMLRIALATIVRNFDLAPAVGTNEKSMEIKDSFVIFPASLECRLIFTPRLG